MASDPVAYLRNAHERAEELTKAATPGPWFVQPHTWDPTDDFAADIGTSQDGQHWGTADVVGHGHESGGVIRVEDAAFIAASDPASVLCRIEAERAILALHEGAQFPRDSIGGVIVCQGCGPSAHDLMELMLAGKQRDQWPCQTVQLLARGWGWTEEAA